MHQPAFTKIMVISVTEPTERRKAFEAFALTSDIPWSFYDAQTQLYPGLKYDAEAAIIRTGRNLSRAELGVYSSHYTLWRWLLDSEFSQMIVFEDDVTIDWQFIKMLSSFDFFSEGIHFLRLFTKVPPQWRYVKTPFFDTYHHLIRITSLALGAQAYLLTKKGAQNLLKHAKTVDRPIDTYMDQYWVHGVPNLALYPFHVFERYQRSSIGEDRFARCKMTFRQNALYYSARSVDTFHVFLNGLSFNTAWLRSTLERLDRD